MIHVMYCTGENGRENLQVCEHRLGSQQHREYYYAILGRYE